MKILLPCPNFKLSAKMFSNEHLELQTAYVAVALRVLHQSGREEDIQALWDNPYVSMWRGHEAQLAEYGITLIEEAVSRNLTKPDSEFESFMYVHLQAASSGSPDKPAWWGNVELHISHKAELLREDYQYYFPLFGSYVSQEFEMVWPT